MKAILDTSFILSAIKNKIDFLEEIKLAGMIPLVPQQVLKELENIINSKKRLKFKDQAKLALKILKKTKTIDIKNNYVDKGLIEYSKKHKVIIATMDKELKQKIKNQKMIIRAKKKLEIVP